MDPLSVSTPSEDDDLDEAAESLPPPPPKPETRPRLAILLQACRAVVGTAQPTEIPVAPAVRPQIPEEEVGPGALRGLKYESPLLAKLREVEVSFYRYKHTQKNFFNLLSQLLTFKRYFFYIIMSCSRK